MSKSTTNEPTVAQIVHARGLQTLDADTSHKILGAVVATLRRMGHEATASALNLSVSTLRNVGSAGERVSVPQRFWLRIVTALVRDVGSVETFFEEFETVTRYVEEDVEEFGRLKERTKASSEFADAVRAAIAGDYDPFSDEDSIPSAIARVVRQRDDERRQKELGIEAWREIRAVLSPECESDQAAIVLARAVVAERDRLKDELREAGETASAAFHEVASLKDDLGSANAQRDRYLSQIESRNEEIARLKALVPSGALGQPASEPAIPREQPEPEKTQSPPKDDAPAVLYENPTVPESWPGRDNPEPVRVTFADPKPKVPTLEDRIEAIRRLALGEAKADIAISLGLRNAAQVHGMTMMDKKRIDRVRQAAPHEKEGELAKIRKEIEAAKGAANG